MTFPFVQRGATPVPQVPPVTKTVIQCCNGSYTCLQGIPADWRCPGCGKLHEKPKATDTEVA